MICWSSRDRGLILEGFTLIKDSVRSSQLWGLLCLLVPPLLCSCSLQKASMQTTWRGRTWKLLCVRNPKVRTSPSLSPAEGSPKSVAPALNRTGLGRLRRICFCNVCSSQNLQGAGSACILWLVSWPPCFLRMGTLVPWWWLLGTFAA